MEAASSTPAVRDQHTLTVGAWVVTRSEGPGVESVGLGFRRSHRVEAPADCRLVILVPSEAVLKRVQESGIIEEGNHACAALQSPP